MTTLMIHKTNSSKNLICFEELTTGLKAQLMKENVYKAMQNLYFWQKNSDLTNFSSMLYQLLCKADDSNKLKIFVGFPEETVCFLLWYTNREESEQKFFDSWLKELNNGKEN